MTTDVDFRSREWQRVCEFFEKRRAEKLAELARPLLNERQADMLRGAIEDCDAVLALGFEPVTVPSGIY